MIIYIYGQDTFGSREYLRESILKFKKQRDPQGYNVVILDGKKVAASKIFAEVNTVPFLGEKKLVVVENLLTSPDKELLAEVIEKVKAGVLESTVLIFWQGENLSKVKEAKELHELLAKEKYSKNHELLSGAKLVVWIEEKIKEKGGTIEKPAAFRMAESGADSWTLAAIINQLLAFSSGRTITVEDVNKFTETKLDDNIFNFTDAVVSGNHKKALTLLEEQRELGEEDGKLFGTILWQFRILIEMSDLLEREGGLTSDQIAKKLGVHPFVAKKNLAIVRQYSLARLESIYEQLLETDIKTKTGRGGQALLLDLFVAKI
ncbi:MAG: DNA polymerase III subunit delta [Patescibacteria group bacterium]|jgi:DNA polymerase-3 subunit delta